MAAVPPQPPTGDGTPLPAWIPKRTYFDLLSKSIIADQLLDSEALLGASYDKLQEEKARSAALERRLLLEQEANRQKLAALERAVVVLLERLKQTMEQTVMIPMDFASGGVGSACSAGGGGDSAMGSARPPAASSRRQAPAGSAGTSGRSIGSTAGLEEMVANAEVIGAIAQETCAGLSDRLHCWQAQGRAMAAEMSSLRERAAELRRQNARLQADAKGDAKAIERLEEAVARSARAAAHARQEATDAHAAADAKVAAKMHEVEEAEARSLALEGTLIDLNDQMIASEGEALALRHFVTQQAELYRTYLHAELLRRFGFVPTSLDNFAFELMPPPALVDDLQQQQYGQQHQQQQQQQQWQQPVNLVADLAPAVYADTRTTDDKLQRARLLHRY
jgi:hypothetical protein